MEKLIQNCQQKEYSVMNRIVDAIRKEREEQHKEKLNEKKELETIKEIYNESNINENTNKNSTQPPSRTNHPNMNKSPPSKINDNGEGRGV